MTKFAIFSFPRSGSTYLCSRLNAHSRILCHYEVFHPQDIGTVRGFGDKAPDILRFTPASRDENPAAFLETLLKYDLGAEAVGFKIFVGHSEEAHRLILNDRTIAKIILQRSTVDAYVSMIIARHTGQYTSTEADGDRVKVAVDAAGLLAFDDRVNRYFAETEEVLRRTNQKYLKVRYEDIVADDAILDTVFSFIGIERGSETLSPFTARQNSEALEDKVSNLKQVLEDIVRLYRVKH